MKQKQNLATGYKPGQVSAFLSSSGGKDKTDERLARLFSSPKTVACTNVLPVTAVGSTSSLVEVNKTNVPKLEKKKKKKRKNKEKSENTEMISDSPSNRNNTESSFPIKHETLVNGTKIPKQMTGVKRKALKEKANDDEQDAKRPRRNRKRDKRADKRTIFVGNCPLSTDKKILKRLFKEYGEIETIRFRCAPPADPNLPRRAIVITKNFHAQGNSYVAYVVFKEEEEAKKALEKNGFLLDGQHLRVDIAALSQKHDKKRSVFVGNLPFTITEEALRSHFQDCGDITNVRIVRDRTTSLGKGICYVQFESKDSVSLALKLNKSELQGRQLRVMVCTNKLKKKTEGKDKTDKKSIKPAKQKLKKPSFAPSNASGSSFKHLLKAKKEKRFRKLKKKRENAKKKDGLSSIFGDMPAAPAKLKKQKQAKVGKGVKRQGIRSGNKSMGGKGKKSQKGSSFKGKGKAGGMKKKSGK